MTTSPEDAEAIKRVLDHLGFLEYLAPKDLAKLVSGAERRPISKGSILIHQGKAGGLFYLLAEGTVGVYFKRQFLDKKLATLGPDSYFGEISLITGEPSGAEVICEEGGIVYTFLRDMFRNVIMANPHVALVIQKAATKRKTEIWTLSREEKPEEKS